MHTAPLMRIFSRLRFILPVATILAGCGSSESAGSATKTDGPSSATELFVRRAAGGLEVVEVDLSTGAATSVAGVLPGTTGDGASVRQLTRAGDRLIASTSSADTTDTYATFALDRASHSWRDLGIASYNPVYSSDLGILVEGGPQSQELPNKVRVVTYDGRTLFEAHGMPGADTRYPRLEALSPAGSWFAMRSGSDAVDVREIDTDGTIGALRQFPRQEPPDTLDITVSCALPTTMVFEEQYPKATWVDRSLAPVASPAFSGDVGALPSTLLDSGRNRVCRYQVNPGDVHDVYAFDDRSLTKVFSFPGKDAQLYAVGDGVHLRSADRPGFATLAKNDGTVIATYAPLQLSAPPSSDGLPTDSVTTVATSLASATKAAVFSVQHGVSSGDYEQTVELDDELFIVAADGTARPTLRLRSVRDPQAPNAAGFVVPSYRFTADGSKLVYVLANRIHVRAIDGDATQDRALDGAAFEDVPVREGSPR